MKGTVKMRWWMVADEQRVRNMPTGLTKQQRTHWLAKATMTPKMLDDLNLSRWRQVISGNVRFGVVAGLLQFMSLSKLMEDEGKAMAHDKADAERRKWAGVAALGATTSEVIGHALAGRAAQGMKFGQGLASVVGKGLTTLGARAGLVTALTVAGLDIAKAEQAKAEGNTGMMVAYRASAAIGGGLAIAILSSALLGSLATPILGVLVVLLVLITVLIEFNKDNPLQDWLERCLFGKQHSQRYLDFDTEQRELKLALEG